MAQLKTLNPVVINGAKGTSFNLKVIKMLKIAMLNIRGTKFLHCMINQQVFKIPPEKQRRGIRCLIASWAKGELKLEAYNTGLSSHVKVMKIHTYTDAEVTSIVKMSS